MRCDHEGLRDSIARLCLVCTLVAAWCLVTLPASELRSQGEPAQTPTEEPKALLSPVELLPVNPESAAAAIPPGPRPPAPPVKLAPELNTLMEPHRGRVTNSVKGIKPANFKEITPGETTREQVLEKLGEPADSTDQDGAEVLSYVIGPFPKVRVTLHENVVSSIVIHLAGPSVRADVAKELGLEDLRPAVVRDDQHRPLGEVYPERGMMFAYAEGATDSQEASVEHVVLETITRRTVPAARSTGTVGPLFPASDRPADCSAVGPGRSRGLWLGRAH